MKRIFCIKYITLITVLLLSVAGALPAAAQCNWGISVQVINSSCLGNGSITVSLTGSDRGNVSSLLYSLAATDGGHSVPASSSPVFTDLAPGSYTVTVQGVCNGGNTQQTQTVTIGSSYVAPVSAASLIRSSLYGCNTGVGKVSVTNGKPPFRLQITNAPAGYTGSNLYTFTGSLIQLDSLAGGDYQFNLTDSCGSSNAFLLSVPQLPSLTTAPFNTSIIPDIVSGCNTIAIASPAIRGGTWAGYTGASDFLSYSVSINGGPKSAYKPFNQPDTITLPAGQSLKDLYNVQVTYYVRPKCEPEFSFPAWTNGATLVYKLGNNCDADFNASFQLGGTTVACFPVTITLTNQNTSQTYTTTLSNRAQSFANNLPFGTYSYNAITNDGYLLDSGTFTDTISTEAPYSIYFWNDQGSWGASTTSAMLETNSRKLKAGTIVQVISPTLLRADTIPSDDYYYFYDGSTGSMQFAPGNYVVRVTDSCGVTDIPFVVGPDDVYQYTSSYETRRVCNGVEVTPTGTATYGGMSRSVVFKLLNPPSGTSYGLIPSGTPVVIPVTGDYQFAIGGNDVVDYGTNVYDLFVRYDALGIDGSQTGGYVCPSKESTDGRIVVVGTGGFIDSTGHYTYRLAEHGNGVSGPYLDTNNTGVFSTATSGGRYQVTQGHTYDVKIEDDCHNTVVPTVSVVDLSTATVIGLSKPEFCVGDSVHLTVLNLPPTNKPYGITWSVPGIHYLVSGQNVVLKRLTQYNQGMIKVLVTSDACADPMYVSAQLKLAPYLLSCYSAVTDTSVNPYMYGLLGNWHQSTSYVYYGARAATDPSDQTDIRHDGTFGDFTDFLSFWDDQQKGVTDTTKWVWNQQSTIFNKYGFELENKDPLGRYNSGLYGYADALPVAVTQNARYREAAFDGFEDYGFGQDSCNTACSTGRMFDFSASQDLIDSTQSHTGKYSMRVTANDTVGVVGPVAPDLDATSPVFSYGTSVCYPQTGLKAVRTSAGALLPSFSLVPGKQVVVSCWVKEAQDCQCTTYTHNQLHLSVSRRDHDPIIVIAQPTGAIIDGWQRYEQVIDVPDDAVNFHLLLQALGTTTAYFDDVRVHPFNANMKSYVYDAVSLRTVADLDENNYATFYEYDDDGTLIRVKKETERGVKTIKETRSALLKQQNDD